MATANDPTEQLALSANGRIILTEVLGRRGHFTAEDLVRWAMDRKPKISRATVYRTLAKLSSADIVGEIALLTPEKVYECSVVRSHHDHLVCTHCGAILEVHSDELETIQDRVCREQDFVPSRHQLVIHGVCRACR